MALTKITPQMFDTSAAGHDFNIDNGTFVVDASANRVGIGTTTPSTLLDVNGVLTATSIAGTLTTAAQTNITSVGTLTALTVDDITINGSTISDAADLILDVGGDITLDADGGDIKFLDGGTEWGRIQNGTGSQVILQSKISDEDMLFQGNDGGSNITALTLDMSEAGAATFNAGVTAPTFTGTLSTAAQTNITSVGTLSALTISGDLTVDTTTLKVDSSNNRVGIGTTNPTAALSIIAAANTEPLSLRASTDGYGYLTYENAAGNDVAYLGLSSALISSGGSTTDFGIRAQSGELVFAIGTNEAMRIDTSRNVGIGKSAGAVRLDVTTPNNGNLAALFTNSHASGSYGVKIQAGSSASNYSLAIADKDNSITHFYFRGDGNLGIGRTDPNAPLDIMGSSSGNFSALRIRNSGTDANSQIKQNPGRLKCRQGLD